MTLVLKCRPFGTCLGRRKRCPTAGAVGYDLSPFRAKSIACRVRHSAATEIGSHPRVRLVPLLLNNATGNQRGPTCGTGILPVGIYRRLPLKGEKIVAQGKRQGRATLGLRPHLSPRTLKGFKNTNAYSMQPIQGWFCIAFRNPGWRYAAAPLRLPWATIFSPFRAHSHLCATLRTHTGLVAC